MQRERLKKIALVTIVSVLLAFVLLILLLSPISKYMIEKYDVKFLGRQVKMDWMYVNPTSGYVYIKNMKVYEAGSDSLFYKADAVHARLSLFRLLKGTYEVNALTIIRPVFNIVQYDSGLNFSDLIKRFASKDSIRSPDKKTLHFNLNKIRIRDGVFNYRDTVIPVHYSIKKVNLSSTGFQWSSDTVHTSYSFVSGNGKGKARGNISINTASLNYRFYANVEKYDLKFLEQYILDVARYGNFAAIMNADVHAEGNFLNAEVLNARGKLALLDFKFGKSKAEDFVRFDQLIVDIRHLNPAEHIYDFDSAILLKPYFKFERYDVLDNYSNMFTGSGGRSGQQLNPSRFNLIFEIAKYVSELSENFFKSDYKVDKIAVVDADFKYNDFALNERFSADLSPLNIRADSINKNKSRVELNARSGIRPDGDIKVFLSINPKDSSDFDMRYTIENVPVAMFNPYFITYTSIPMDRGKINISGKWHVRNGIINSDNHLLLLDPRLGRRIRQKDVRHMPLPLIMYFVLERGNVIDYEIPVNGNLNNPRFHLKDVLLDLLSNIFAKPPSIPYSIRVKQAEREIEKSLGFKWEFRQSELSKNQVKFLDKTARFLKAHPQSFIHIEPRLYESKEKEYILFFEAKKAYYLRSKGMKQTDFGPDDSMAIERLSVRDSGFTGFLNKHSSAKLYTIQGRCMALVGRKTVDTRYAQLTRSRASVFKAYFQSRDLGNQIRFKNNVVEVPVNGYTFYSLTYNGVLPEDLLRAYEQMYDMNNAAPRKRFRKNRISK